MDLSLVCLLPFVVLIGLLPSGGDAVMCYQCNSGDIYQGKACLDVTNEPKVQNLMVKDNNLVQNCSDLAPRDTFEFVRCRTMVQDVEGEVRTIRSCATWPDKGTDHDKGNRCIDRTGTAKIKVRYCECEGDFCNGGSTIHTSLSLLLVVYVLLQLVRSIST